MKVVLAGGSGSLGRRVAQHLAERGHEVVVLSRSPHAGSAFRQVEWDGRTVGPWASELSGAAVVNLAGELVDRRPTTAGIELLTRSRVEPTTALAAAASGVSDPPAVWIQMSTLAIFGDGGDQTIDETSPVAEGPPQMAGVARAWEAAAADVRAERQVILRTAVVLDPGAPAFNRLTGLTKWGLGGRVASGQQWVSWLHIEDFLTILHRTLTDADLSGVVHATSPNPVRNAELMATLRRQFRRPPAPPTPAPFVRLGSIVLRTDPALALTGRRCVPTRLTASGTEFTHPRLEPALTDLLSG